MIKENTNEVKTIIVLECKGQSTRRVVHERWWNGLSIEKIADTTKEAVEGIV